MSLSSLRTEWFTIETVAVELHTSRSQIQRALADEGLTFSALSCARHDSFAPPST
jgi:hypothetical protein